MKHLQGRIIKVGRCRGQALVSPEPLSFFGGVDATTGIVVEPGHPLQGQSIAGRVMVFPTSKGSTVGSYILYRLKKADLAPAGIINAESEAIVAVGAIMAEIPMLDHVDITQIQTGDFVTIDGGDIHVESSG